MKVIAGLGNPGAEYANTPHSIGFEVVDALAREIGASWRASSSFGGELAAGMLGGVKVVLVKPMTYMNLSGDCVAPVVKYHNATAADLVVVSDDIDLPVGRIRIRKGGSAGGHNGIKNIIAHLGHDEFLRVKIGVGEKPTGYDLADYVLGHFPKEEVTLMEETYERAGKAALSIMEDGADKAMNRFNGKNQ